MELSCTNVIGGLLDRCSPMICNFTFISPRILQIGLPLDHPSTTTVHMDVCGRTMKAQKFLKFLFNGFGIKQTQIFQINIA